MFIHRRALRVAVALASCVSPCHPSFAAEPGETLDQQHFVSPCCNGVLIGEGYSIAQIFTVGVAGRLSRIGLQVGQFAAASPLDIELRSLTAGGLPDISPSALIASVSVSASEVPTTTIPNSYTEFALSGQAFDVGLGSKYAIVLRSDTPVSTNYYITPIERQSTFGTPYLGGDLVFQNGDGTPFIGDPGFDIGFSTYVSQVPEPATFSLAGLLLMGAIGIRRRANRPWMPTV